MAMVTVLASGSLNNQREAARLDAFRDYQQALSLAIRARVSYCLLQDAASFAELQSTAARKFRAAVRLAMLS